MTNPEGLREALRPFAELAERFDPDRVGGNMPRNDDDSVMEWPMVDKTYRLTLGHLRAARAALAPVAEIVTDPGFNDPRQWLGQPVQVAPVAELWCLHIEGPDDVHPAPSREDAQKATDLFNATFPPSDYPSWPRAVAKVIEWPHGARAHALEAPSFAEYWLLSKTTQEAPRPCGLTLMLACPLPDGHSGRCEYLPHHVRRIADEMEAWSEKKMIGPNSSRIDRTVVREWARQLRGE